MNGYERVMAVIEGRIPDKTPNANIIMMLGAKEIGVKYADYCRNSNLLVEGNLACAQKYGLDVVTVMQSPISEAEGLGAEVVFPEDDVPYPKTPLIKSKTDLLSCKIVKPEDCFMMGNAIKSIESYKTQVKGELGIIGWVEGCFAQASDLMGVNEFLIGLADIEDDDETFIPDLMDFILEQEILYAKAQINAGADIIGVGDAISSVAGPYAYRELAGTYQRKLMSAIKEMGAKTKLHICGNITPFIDQIPYEVCDIIDIDHMVNINKAKEIVNGRSVISGNYDPVGILLQSTPAQVSEAVINCMHSQDKTRYFSAAGCEVPKETPVENLLTVKSVLEEQK